MSLLEEPPAVKTRWSLVYSAVMIGRSEPWARGRRQVIPPSVVIHAKAPKKSRALRASSIPVSGAQELDAGEALAAWCGHRGALVSRVGPRAVCVRRLSCWWWLRLVHEERPFLEAGRSKR